MTKSTRAQRKPSKKPIHTAMLSGAITVVLLMMLRDYGRVPVSGELQAAVSLLVAYLVVLYQPFSRGALVADDED